MSPSLSAVIITLNEEKNIEDCVRSVSFCDEVILIDSGSTDGTVPLAEKLGAKIWRRSFDHFAAQKNFGISKASGEWVLLVDADERVSDGLKGEIKDKIPRGLAEGYYFPRINRIFGRWMRHGENANDYQLRLAKRQKAVFTGPVHERVELSGKTERMKNPLLHHSTPSVSAYMGKLNSYTALEAKRREGKPIPRIGDLLSRPLLKFMSLTFLKRGFMDGLEGFIFSALSAYYDFVSLAKHWEKKQERVSER